MQLALQLSLHLCAVHPLGKAAGQLISAVLSAGRRRPTEPAGAMEEEEDFSAEFGGGHSSGCVKQSPNPKPSNPQTLKPKALNPQP